MKNKVLLICVSALSMLLVSCIQDYELLENGAGKSVKSVKITADDFKAGDEFTRSHVSVGDGGVEFNWSENDTIGIFPTSGYQLVFPIGNGAGSKCAQFDGGGWELRESSLYTAYYPFDFYNKNGRSIAVNYIGQVQTGNGNISHIGAFDYMAASAVTPENGEVTFDFKHLGALIQFKLKLSEADTLFDLTMEAEEPLFTRRGYINLMQGRAKIDANEKFGSLSMTLDRINAGGGDDELVVYMMIAPADLQDRRLFVTLSGTKSRIVYEFEGRNFEAGKAYSLSSDMGEYEDNVLQIADYRGKAVSVEGGIISLEYLSNLDCEYTISDAAKEWIKPVDTKVVTTRTADFEVLRNTTGSSRVGFITVKGLESTLAVEYGIIQGTAGMYVISEDGGRFPVGILKGEHTPVDQNHGLDKLVDFDLNTCYEVASQKTSVVWEGPYVVGIDTWIYARSKGNTGISKTKISMSDDGYVWSPSIGVVSPNPSSGNTIGSRSCQLRSRFFKIEFENFGGETIRIPESGINENIELDRDYTSFDDLFNAGGTLYYSETTPMGKDFENRHKTTEQDRVWLLDPENEPALLSSAPSLTLREYKVNLYPFGTPVPADVNQRGIGDCAAMAAFAQMAYMFPDFIKSIITDHKDGTYTVKMFDPQAVPVEVRIKSTFLGDDKGLEATAGKDGKANWATVLEKAVMKWNYIYKVNPDIEGIQASNATPLFTGRGDYIYFAPYKFLSSQLDQIVRIALENNMMVVGGFLKPDISIGGPTTRINHAYSFMYSSNANAMFAMRNPWGHNPNGTDGDDGVMHVADDGYIHSLIYFDIIYPGIAEEYAIKNLSPYLPPAYNETVRYRHY